MSQWPKYAEERFEAVFRGESARKKLFLLHYIESESYQWDEFRLEVIEPGLFSPDCEVRARTLEVICQQSRFLQSESRQRLVDTVLQRGGAPGSDEKTMSLLIALVGGGGIQEILSGLESVDQLVQSASIRALDNHKDKLSELELNTLVNHMSLVDNPKVIEIMKDFIVQCGHGYLLEM